MTMPHDGDGDRDAGYPPAVRAHCQKLKAAPFARSPIPGRTAVTGGDVDVGGMEKDEPFTRNGLAVEIIDRHLHADVRGPRAVPWPSRNPQPDAPGRVERVDAGQRFRASRLCLAANVGLADRESLR